MTVTDRAIHAGWNVGIEDITPLSDDSVARAIHTAWNVGVWTELVARALHAAWNVGFWADVIARAIHAAWNVEMRTSLYDPWEWILYGINLMTVEDILRGR
jgi:precorrin isomerase